MTYFKGIIFTVLNILVMFFTYTAFGLYSPTSDFIESDINFSFEPQAFPEASLNEIYTPVLLFNDQEGYCVIPLNEQDRKKLNIQEILKQNSLDESFAFEQMTNLKPCQPEIAQLVLNSINKQTNQLAIAQAVVVGGAIYLGVCATADYITTKKAKAEAEGGYPDIAQFLIRTAVGIMCFPVYGLSFLIRVIENDGHDPLERH